jgi:lipopolysaccharide biosynthesis glycosyltransferase
MPLSNDTTKDRSIGVYCLANDNALEWFQAFVRSLRKFNPTLPLTVIPYDANIERLKTLRNQFQFSLMEEATYVRFDSIASRVAGQNIPGGTFRKLCCFFGEYDTFLFLDSDIVVTMGYDGLFQDFQNSEFDLVYFDPDHKVFKLPFARKMMAEYRAYGFNSGAFLSRKQAVTQDQIMSAVASGEKIRDDFAIWGEQPFVNYLFQIHRSRLSHVSALAPELTFKPKSCMPFKFDAISGHFLDPEEACFPFIHWANEEYPIMHHQAVFLEFRTLGMTPSEKRRYYLEFFYRRFRARSKDCLRRIGLFDRLLDKRDAWLAGKHKKAKLVTQRSA